MGRDEGFIASGGDSWRVKTRQKLHQVAVAKIFVENKAKKSPERGILEDLHLLNAT